MKCVLKCVVYACAGGRGIQKEEGISLSSASSPLESLYCNTCNACNSPLTRQSTWEPSKFCSELSFVLNSVYKKKTATHYSVYYEKIDKSARAAPRTVTLVLRK